MITGYQFAEQARSGKYNGIPYSKLDCQAFVEEVAKDSGIRKKDGSIYNWKGSNSMWRNIQGWKGTVSECRAAYGEIPLGAWVFIRKTDGGEADRGYTDNLGNFAHVGIYCNLGGDPVRDSTRYAGRDGVGYRPLKSFTHVLLPDFIDYSEDDEGIYTIETAAQVIRDPNSNNADWIEALTYLYTYLKGD